MTTRPRRLAIFLPVLVTVLLAVVVGALVIVQGQKQHDQLAEADAVAERFLSDLGMFQGDVSREIGGAKDADPAALRRVLKAAIADPPELGQAPQGGVEQSSAYARAREAQEALLDPYRALDRELRRGAVARTFIAAARDALALRASDYVGSGVLADSGAVRTRLIPAFTRARDEFAAVRVPKGQAPLAASVTGAVQYVIDQATTLAVSIESNRSFSFTYADEFRAAASAVDDYATVVNADVTEAINAVVSPR